MERCDLKETELWKMVMRTKRPNDWDSPFTKESHFSWQRCDFGRIEYGDENGTTESLSLWVWRWDIVHSQTKKKRESSRDVTMEYWNMVMRTERPNDRHCDTEVWYIHHSPNREIRVDKSQRWKWISESQTDLDAWFWVEDLIWFDLISNQRRDSTSFSNEGEAEGETEF